MLVLKQGTKNFAIATVVGQAAGGVALLALRGSVRGAFLVMAIFAVSIVAGSATFDALNGDGPST